MSNGRAEAITAYEKPWAYVVLTKPDVTFLVVITTVAGFYLGVQRPHRMGAPDEHALRHTARRRRHGSAESIRRAPHGRRDAPYRTRGRCPPAILQPKEVLIFGVATIIGGTIWLLVAVNALAAFLALATSVSYLGGLHSAQDAHNARNRRGRRSWSAPAADRLGRSARFALARRMDSLRDFICLAVSALHGHRLDVPRRLWPRRNPDAPGS